jgi:hypothetical protein
VCMSCRWHCGQRFRLSNDGPRRAHAAWMGASFGSKNGALWVSFLAVSGPGIRDLQGPKVGPFSGHENGTVFGFYVDSECSTGAGGVQKWSHFWVLWGPDLGPRWRGWRADSGWPGGPPPRPSVHPLAVGGLVVSHPADVSVSESSTELAFGGVRLVHGGVCPAAPSSVADSGMEEFRESASYVASFWCPQAYVIQGPAGV